MRLHFVARTFYFRQQLGLTNVQLQVADALSWDEQDQYDLVYTRFLLTHLSQPQKVIDKMNMAVKPGGLVAIEDLQFSGHFCYPDCPAFERYIQLYQQVVINQGGEPEIGPKLPGMLKQAGFKEVNLNLVQPIFMDGEGKSVAQITMEKIRSAVLEQGLSSPDEIETIISELKQFGQNSETIISLPRIFQVCGRK